MACNHMIGITQCNDGEKLLLFGHDKWWKERKPEPRDIVFSFCPYCGIELRPTREERGEIELALCSDCPPPNYPTDETRCAPCPRRPKSSEFRTCGHREGFKVCILPPGHCGGHLSG